MDEEKVKLKKLQEEQKAKSQKEELLVLCKETIRQYFSLGDIVYKETSTPNFLRHCGVFITLYLELYPLMLFSKSL